MRSVRAKLALIKKKVAHFNATKKDLKIEERYQQKYKLYWAIWKFMATQGYRMVKRPIFDTYCKKNGLVL